MGIVCCTLLKTFSGQNWNILHKAPLWFPGPALLDSSKLTQIWKETTHHLQLIFAGNNGTLVEWRAQAVAVHHEYMDIQWIYHYATMYIQFYYILMVQALSQNRYWYVLCRIILDYLCRPTKLVVSLVYQENEQIQLQWVPPSSCLNMPGVAFAVWTVCNWGLSNIKMDNMDWRQASMQSLTLMYRSIEVVKGSRRPNI